MKMNRPAMVLLVFGLVSSLSGCASAPNPDNDPRQGGLFGGIAGEMGGDYDLREQQRLDRLDTLRQQESQLRRENAEIEWKIQGDQEELNDLKQSLQITSDELGNLRKEVGKLEKQNKVKKSERNSLKKKLAAVKKQIEERELALRKETSSAESKNREAIESLQKQVDQLRKEFEAIRAREESLSGKDNKS